MEHNNRHDQIPTEIHTFDYSKSKRDVLQESSKIYDPH